MANRLIAVALLGLAACTTFQAPPAPFALAGSSWQRIDDEDANPHGASLAFETTRASGYTGCNRWFAEVTHTDAELRFGPIGMTRMSCQADIRAVTERHFVSALERTRFYHLEGEELVLADENKALVARFICTSESCPRAP